MNYDDELERARARRSRRRENGTTSTRTTRTTSHGTDDSLNLKAEAGSRAAKNRATSSSYRRKKKKSNKTGKIILGVLVVIIALVIAVAAGVFGYFNEKLEDSQTKLEFKQAEVVNENIPVEVREKMEKGFWTVAVFGVDSRDNSLGKGNQSDVIMIANLNRNTGEIKLVSVFRDTYLNINDKNTYNKINAAYASGGPEAAVKAINKNLDLNITHYATFNWKAVATVINILGGVEIDISPSEFYYINAFITETVKGTGIGSTQLKSAGVHNLDGVQAVAYGRLRLMDSDYARTERQRIVIQKAFEKVKTANLSTLNDVVGHVFEMSATNIGFEDLAGLVKDVSKYHLGETTGFPAARGEARIKIGNDKLSCVIPQTLESNVISLHNFLFGEENYSPSSTVLEISAKIAEVSGLATEAEEIGHVAVDQGYIPKKTTAAATEAKTTEAEDDETVDETADSTSESDDETSESEDESGTADESSSSDETEESTESLFPGSVTGPASMGPGGMLPTEENTDGPMGPGSRPTAPTQSYGPGSQIIQEATTEAAGPGVRPGSTPITTNPGGGTATTIPGGSSTTTRPGGSSTTTTPGGSTTETEGSGTIQTNPSSTTAATTGSGSTSNDGPASSAPSSPADVTISSGTSTGPAAQATTGAAPGV
ncbi:MAG: LCP family protein [Lachnospiraceae bacterium]|nr:LCP family protein [Lachnospiraceae bacterium]